MNTALMLLTMPLAKSSCARVWEAPLPPVVSMTLGCTGMVMTTIKSVLEAAAAVRGWASGAAAPPGTARRAAWAAASLPPVPAILEGEKGCC